MASTTASKNPKSKAAALSNDDGQPRAHHKVVPSSVKKGDVMAIVHFVTVDETRAAGDYLVVTPVEGPSAQPFHVNGRPLVENMYSADFYAEERKITGTEAEHIFGTAFNKPLSVCFVKQGDKKTGEGANEERVLRGRLLDRDPWKGRSRCIDYDIEINNRRTGSKDYPVRWVDHRTILWFVVDGVRYVIK